MSAELPADSPDGAADDTPKVSVTLFYLVSVPFFVFLFFSPFNLIDFCTFPWLIFYAHNRGGESLA